MKRPSISKHMRMRVFIRDGYVCQYCGDHPPYCKLEVDHRLALANGGKHEMSNFVTACHGCNRGKGVMRTLTAARVAHLAEIELAAIDGEHLYFDGDPWLRAIYGELVV